MSTAGNGILNPAPFVFRTSIAAAAALALAACGGSPGPASYLASGTSGISFIQWQPGSSGDRIQGTITDDTISGTAPNESVSVESAPFTRAINGSSVTMNLNGGFLVGTQTLTGTLTGNTLTLNILSSSGSIQPDTLTQSDTTAYNQAVAALHKSVRQANLVAAQAQAAQQRQQQDSQDLQTAQTDLATLQAVSFGSDMSALANDVKQTNSDLAGEKNDAANGNGSDCYNLQSNVEYDAQSNVDYDIQSNLDYDLQTNLIPDIQAARQAITTLQGDQATLASDGLTAPPGDASAVSAAHRAIRQAIAAANADIDQANGDDAEAYAIPNAMATGSCSGDGLGNPPAPVKHIH